MKKLNILVVSLFIGSFSLLNAQDNVGIGTTTPEATAVLDVSANDKGMLVPRLTTAQRVELHLQQKGFWFMMLTMSVSIIIKLLPIGRVYALEVQELQVQQVLKAHKVIQVQQVHRVQQEQLVQRVRQVHKVQREPKVHKVIQAQQVRRAQPEQLVPQVLQVHLGRQVLKAHRVQQQMFKA